MFIYSYLEYKHVFIFIKIRRKNIMKQKKINSIHIKLFLSLFLICIIPLIFTGFYSYNEFKKILYKNLQNTNIQMLKQVDNEISSYFNQFIIVTNMASTSYDIINVNDSNNISYIPDILKSMKNCD
jgi:methyl-accepting chemotaxis protein